MSEHELKTCSVDMNNIPEAQTNPGFYVGPSGGKGKLGMEVKQVLH